MARRARAGKDEALSYSIVILSRNIDNLTKCVAALRWAGDMARVIVVWDEICSHEDADAVSNALQGCHPLVFPIELHAGSKPFCFARNANIGIRAATTDDVLLLNDDALLETESGFANMAEQWPSFGVLSARVRGPANPIHDVLGIRTISDDISRVSSSTFVPFVAVLIRRWLIDRIGLLDERFTPGSYEDNDYCRRAHESNSLVGVYNGTVVNHETLPHTFRPEGKPQLYDLNANRARFNEKWGIK